MSGRISARLKELNITLPNAAAPAANYVPFVRSGNLLFIAGQLSIDGAGNVCARHDFEAQARQVFQRLKAGWPWNTLGRPC